MKTKLKTVKWHTQKAFKRLAKLEVIEARQICNTYFS